MATLNLDRSPRHPAPPSWTGQNVEICFVFFLAGASAEMEHSPSLWNRSQDFAETALGLLAEVEADAAALDGSDGEWED